MGQADFIWVKLGIALAVTAALIALPVALVVSLALIRLFRWRVARSMRAAAGVPQDAATLPADGGKGTLAIEWIEPTRTREEALPPLLGDARRRSRELAASHAEAACLYPLLFTFLWWRPHDTTVLQTAALFGLLVALFGTPVVFAGMMVFTKQPGFLALAASTLVAVLLAFDLTIAADVYPMLYIGAAVPLVVVLMLVILRREPRLVIILVLAIVLLLLAFIPISGRGSKAGTNLVEMWFMWAGVPTVAVVLLSLRRFRAVGPPVYASMLLFLVGIVIGGAYATFFSSVRSARSSSARIWRSGRFSKLSSACPFRSCWPSSVPRHRGMARASIATTRRSGRFGSTCSPSESSFSQPHSGLLPPGLWSPGLLAPTGAGGRAIRCWRSPS